MLESEEEGCAGTEYLDQFLRIQASPKYFFSLQRVVKSNGDAYFVQIVRVPLLKFSRF